MTLLHLIWQKSLLAPEPTVLRSCLVSFKKTSSTDSKKPMQRAHWLQSLAQIAKLFALQGCVICKSSAESPLASLLPAGRDKGQSCWAVPSSRSPSLNVLWIHRELPRSTGGMQHEQRMHSYPLQLAGAQAINTAENFTSWICFEPITSKEQLYHAGERYPQIKTSLQSFVISAGAVMTTLEGITVAGFPFDKYCLL